MEKKQKFMYMCSLFVYNNKTKERVQRDWAKWLADVVYFINRFSRVTVYHLCNERVRSGGIRACRHWQWLLGFAEVTGGDRASWSFIPSRGRTCALADVVPSCTRGCCCGRGERHGFRPEPERVAALIRYYIIM